MGKVKDYEIDLNNNENIKQCSKCLNYLELDKFNLRNPNKSTILRSECIKCRSLRNKLYYINKTKLKLKEELDNVISDLRDPKINIDSQMNKILVHKLNKVQRKIARNLWDDATIKENHI